MLLPFPTKIISTLLIATTLVGCGKKIGEAGSSSTIQEQAGADLPSNFELSFEARSPADHLYSYPVIRDGIFTLPQILDYGPGLQANLSVRIYYNYLEEEDYEFSCLYQVPAGEFDLKFIRCENIDMRDLNIPYDNLPSHFFPIDQGKQIVIKIQSTPASYPLSIAAPFEVDWK